MIEDLVSFIIFGIIQGSIYALLAMGFSLVYGVGGILNQAHGAFYVIAMYIFYSSFINVVEYGLMVGMILAVILTPLIGGLIYLLLIKPLKDSHVGVVIVTFAFAFFTEQLVRIVVDATYHDMPPLISGFFTIFGVNIPYHYLLIIIVSLSLLFIITLYILNQIPDERNQKERL